MNVEHKRNILKIIAKLAMTDGQLLENEVHFLHMVGISFNFSKAETLEIVKDGDISKLKLPKSEQQRMNILYYLLFMMKADNQVSESEITLVKKLGFKLGFRSRLVEDMIATISSQSNPNVTPDSLLANVKKYLN